MNNRIELTLPIPPSVNKLWRTGYKHGSPHVFLSDEARNYKFQVNLLSKHVEPLTKNVILQIVIYRPRDSGDLDNYLKAMLDGLQGNLYNNDKQIKEIHAYKQTDRKNPRVELLAWEED